VIILYFYYKFGSDGSTGYRQTKQNPSGDATVVIDDNRLFVTTMVPIQIRVHDESDDNDNPEIIYHNLLCNSPQTCRPCRLCYERETAGKTILLGWTRLYYFLLAVCSANLRLRSVYLKSFLKKYFQCVII
jgi:hypothetical protein